MKLTYRGISYIPRASVAENRTVFLTYRGVTHCRFKRPRDFSRPVPLIYRGQKYNDFLD